MTAEDDRRFMGLALGLARRGLGNVWPNPAVGAVIVQGTRIVGRGWTRPGGRPHAEVVALAQAGAAARAATAYVTLEPCAHHGVTPPCANALVAAGVARVVSALEDPDPRVSGRGHAILRAAGVAVDTGVMAAEAEALQRGFLSRIRRGRPMVTLKLAASLDGRIATASGESRWITGPEARRRVHLMRAMHDAVLVGAGTARADDPLLTVRDLGVARQPVRVVAARNLGLPDAGALALSARDVPLWLVHGHAAAPERVARWQGLGATTLAVDEAPGGIDPAAMLAALGQAGLTRVFCEGGGQLAASLLDAGAVDEIAAFSAGVALGGDARAALADLGLARLAEARRFRLASVEPVGADILARWTAQ